MKIMKIREMFCEILYSLQKEELSRNKSQYYNKEFYLSKKLKIKYKKLQEIKKCRKQDRIYFIHIMENKFLSYEEIKHEVKKFEQKIQEYGQLKWF